MSHSHALGLLFAAAACGRSPDARTEPNAPAAASPSPSASTGGAASSAASATQSRADAEPPPGTLLARLGGRKVLVRVVDSLVKALEADPKLNLRFASVLTTPRLDDFKTNLVDELCVAAGGTCSYRGRSMKDAHRALHVSEAEWNAFMLDLQSALDENEIAPSDQMALLSVLAPMRASIIDVTGPRRR